jgi:hypothetical protein
MMPMATPSTLFTDRLVPSIANPLRRRKIQLYEQIVILVE